MTINKRSQRSSQHGLFESEGQKKAREDSLVRRIRYEEKIAKLDTIPGTEATRISIVRGFLSLHFDDKELHDAMKRPLQCLGGKTLEELCLSYWKVVNAWMKEIRMFPGEKQFYIQEYETNAQTKEK